LKIAKPDLEMFSNLNYVKKAEINDGMLVLTVENAGEHLQDILNMVGKAEYIAIRPASLNDVFLHFTGREIRPESGEGGIFQRMMRAEARR
jgi:ABC-2 type transport system ATP-binding protein